MQENDQSRRTGRPSLLSEQSPAGDSHSILSKLDGGGKVASPAGNASGAGRVAAIAAAVAVTGGLIGWALSGPDAPAEAPMALASVAPKPQTGPGAATAAPLPLAPAPVPQPQAADEVSAAAILDGRSAKSEPADKSLAASLEAPQKQLQSAPQNAHGPVNGKDELMALLDKHSPAPADTAAGKVSRDAPKPEAKHEVKPAREAVVLAHQDKAEHKDKSEHKDRPAAREAAERKEAASKQLASKERTAKEKAAKDKAAKDDRARVLADAKAKPAVKAMAKAAAVDSDVVLLAALLAHTKKAQPARSKASSEYKKCGTLDSAQAVDKCREKLCEPGAKVVAAECKAPAQAPALAPVVAKASS